MGVGELPMGGAAAADCRLGGRALVPSRPRLCVDRRRLALALPAGEGVKKCQDTKNAAKPTAVFLRIMKILWDIL